MNEKHTIELPAPEPGFWLSSNDRPHWVERNRLTQTWRTIAAWQFRSARIPAMKKATIRATICRNDRRKADAHNMMPTIKAVIDGIVDAGVLPDDSNEFVPEVTTVAGPRVSKRAYPGGLMVVTITEVET